VAGNGCQHVCFTGFGDDGLDTHAVLQCITRYVKITVYTMPLYVYYYIHKQDIVVIVYVSRLKPE